MEKTITVDTEQIAKSINLPSEKVRAAVDLLDDGNTVPFITRYRKDRTGGLDEEQIRGIQEQVAKLRLVAERKESILKSLQSRDKLSDDLRQRIEAATSVSRLEDLYLPFKTKKQTLASVARSRGLEPLALEVLRGEPATADLRARAGDFVNADKGLATVEDVLQGVRHIIAETFSENLSVRDALRKMLRDTGMLHSTRHEETLTAKQTQQKNRQKSRKSASRETPPEPATTKDESPQQETPPEVAATTSESTDVSEADPASVAEPVTAAAAGTEPIVEHSPPAGSSAAKSDPAAESPLADTTATAADGVVEPANQESAEIDGKPQETA